MNIGRSLNKATGKTLTHRIYKYNTLEELKQEMSLYEKHYKPSVEIQSHGRIDDGTLAILRNLDNENVVNDLGLKFNDFFLLTRENISIKIADEERLQKRILRKKASTLNITKKTSLEDKGQILWSGDAKEVAEKLGKTRNAIYNDRSKYLELNPGFIPPIVPKKSKKTRKYVRRKFSEDEMKLFWNNSATNLAPILKLSSKRINEIRRNYCQNNPDFIIPETAKFKFKVKNPNKPNFHYSNEDINILWSADCKTVSELLKRSENAITQARRKYCVKYPDFIVPAVAKYSIPNSLFNKAEVVTETVPHVIAQSVITEAIANTESPLETKSTSINTENIGDIATFLNSLKVKPKKIKIGDMELEF